LLAAIEALKRAPKDDRVIEFYADSVYVLRGASQWIHGWSKRNWQTAEGKPVLNQPLWQELQGILQANSLGKRIKWKYVRGHQGIAGNERCDELSVLFSKGEIPDLVSASPLSYPYEVWQIPDDTSIPEMKALGTEKKKAPMGYLSAVGTVLTLHANWDSCQKATSGQPRARFKKIMSPQELSEVIQQWGFAESQLKDLRSKS
jgi:ribonuclease HI